MTQESRDAVVPPVEHVIVLVLENRSFDHMLGHLDHPSPDFDGVRADEMLGNYLRPRDVTSAWYPATDAAGYTFPVDPDHEHYAVLGQFAAIGTRTNTGFVASYVHKALESARNENRRALLHAWARRVVFGALIAALLLMLAGWWWVLAAGIVAVLALVGFFLTRARPVTPDQEHNAEAVAGAIMDGFAPAKVPVLCTLAKEFALCQRWFCSVPGETWPNRNFFHAATSSGSTDIELGFYRDRTIFETLDRAGSSWKVYYGQLPPQVFFFSYVLERAIDNSGSLHDLFDDIDNDRLPAYSFVEPHHGLLGKRPSCSQHPGNNITDKTDGSDFRAGERLIAEIYQHLKARPTVFEKTIFVVTYDEHGGTYDHRQPPATVAPGSEHDTWTRQLMRWLSARKYPFGFNFRRLGPRVPCVVVSPWIPPGTLDQQVRDHASIPATLRRLFAPDAPPLTRRDRHAPTIHQLLTLATPRGDGALPDLTDAVASLGNPPLFPDDQADVTPSQPESRFDWQLTNLTHAIYDGTVKPAAQKPEATRNALRAPAAGKAVGSLRRRRVGAQRKRRVRTMSPDQLRKVLDETEFWLGAMAAERTQTTGSGT
jgi:phospholipase C